MVHAGRVHTSSFEHAAGRSVRHSDDIPLEPLCAGAKRTVAGPMGTDANTVLEPLTSQHRSAYTIGTQVGLHTTMLAKSSDEVGTDLGSRREKRSGGPYANPVSASRRTNFRWEVCMSLGTKALRHGIAILVVTTACTPAQSASPDPSGQAPPASASTQEPAVASDELQIAITSFGNEALDPIKGPNDNGRYLRLMFDSLVGADLRGQELSKETGVASDWTVSEDGKVYTFSLREGLTFSNGEELTAEDVKFSLERIHSPEAVTSYAGVLQRTLDTVTVKDPYEVEVRLNQPLALLPYILSPLFDTSGLVVPKDYFEEVGEDAFGQEPVGSGPYKLVDRQAGAFMTFERAFPEHFAIGVPRYERVTMRLVPEESSRLAMLRAGDADFIDIGIDQIAQLEDDGFKIFEHQAGEPLVLFFQLQRPGEATADINVRKALSYAINREELNEFIMQGLGEVTGNFFIGQLGGEPLEADPYDLEQAQQYLNQTEYGEGGEQLILQLQVQPREGWPQMLTIAETLQSYWDAIGIQTVITYRDYGAFRAEWGDGTLPAPAVSVINFAGRLDWFGTTGSVFRCDGVLESVCDPQFDELTNLWGATTDQDRYQELAREIEEHLRENYFYVGILSGALHFAGNEQIREDFSPGVITRGINILALVAE